MPRTPQDRVKVNLFLQADVLAAMKKMATIRGTTYSDLVREACRRFVVAEASKLIEEQKQLDAVAPQGAGSKPSTPMPFHVMNPITYPADTSSPQPATPAPDDDPRERG